MPTDHELAVIRKLADDERTADVAAALVSLVEQDGWEPDAILQVLAPAKLEPDR